MMSSLGCRVTGFALAGALALGLGMTASGQARELKMAPGFAPGTAIAVGAEAFTKEVERLTKGEITFKIFPLTLLSVPQMLNGIRDGVADVGLVMAPVFVPQFPEGNLIGDLAMLGTSATAMAGAATEYFVTCEACQAEFAKQNMVYLGSGSSALYDILSTKPFVNPGDLKGAKLRSANATYNRWAQHFGAVALTLPGNEIFEAVKQGAVDGAMNGTVELTNIRLIDVVKHVTLGIPGGTYHVIDVSKTNRNTWKSLTDVQRRAFMDAGAHAAATMTVQYVKDGIDNVDLAKKRNIPVHQPSPELVAASKAFVQADLATVGSIAKSTRGIADADAKIARFQQLVAKWDRLTADLGSDIPKLTALYKSEIFDKLDPTKYGQ